MKRHALGFTLFEVMLSIVILIIMVGGIFGSVRAVINAVESLQVTQEGQMNREALVELFRKNFSALPPKAVLLLGLREESGTYYSELAIENSPGSFSWGTEAGFWGLILLGQEKDADGLLSFNIVRLDSDEAIRNREIPPKLTVARGFRVFRWEFFDEHEQRWTTKWDNRARRPNLVRLEFQFQGEAFPLQVTFTLPWTSARNSVVSNE